MRIPLLILVAATVGACSSPTPVVAPSTVTTAATPGEVPGNQMTNTEQPPAPEAPTARTLTGVVKAPQGFIAQGDSPKRYLLGLEDQQAPLANTAVFVTDDKGNYLGIQGTTDVEGRFTLTLSLELAGRPLVINAFAVDAAGQRVTLRTIATTSSDGQSAGAQPTEANIDFASTVVTQLALTNGSLADFSPETFAQIIAKLEAALDPKKLAQFDLTSAQDMLRELSNIVDADPALRDAIKGLGQGDAGRFNNSNRRPQDPGIIFSGQVK